MNMPGYALLLAGTWLVTPAPNLSLAILIQILLDGLAALCLVWLTKKLFGLPAGWVAGLWYALYLPQIRLTVLPFRYAWVACPAIFALTLLVVRQDFSRPWPYRTGLYLLVGLLVGLGTLFRETFFLLPLALAYGLGLQAQRAREGLLAAASIFAGVSVILAPWIVRNFLEFNRFIPTSSNAGQILFVSLGEYPQYYDVTFNDMAAHQAVLARGHTGAYGSPEYGEAAMQEAWRSIKVSPARYLTVLADRARRATVGLPNELLYFWVPSPITVELIRQGYQQVGWAGLWAYAQDNPQPVIDALLFRLSDLSYYAALLLALVGLWICRRRWRTFILMCLVWLYFLAAQLPFYVSAYHVVGWTWIYLPFAAAALVWSGRKLYCSVLF
jgi:hypothetical protein